MQARYCILVHVKYDLNLKVILVIDRLQQYISSIKQRTGQGIISLTLFSLLTLTGGGLILNGVAADVGSRPTTTYEVEIPNQNNNGSSVDVPYALVKATPTLISIPSQSIESKIIQVGKNADGSVEVPSGTQLDFAAWYKHSPTPGEIGPSVILGHVDSLTDRSIFFYLDKVQAGDKVYVKRGDGTTAVFTVYKSELYPKDQFPTETVYGSADGAELRLITCGGFFDKSARDYEDNRVVFARFTKKL
ncbi:class F sortase [soil metagenome]